MNSFDTGLHQHTIVFVFYSLIFYPLEVGVSILFFHDYMKINDNYILGDYFTNMLYVACRWQLDRKKMRNSFGYGLGFSLWNLDLF